MFSYFSSFKTLISKTCCNGVWFYCHLTLGEKAETSNECRARIYACSNCKRCKLFLFDVVNATFNLDDTRLGDWRKFLMTLHISKQWIGTRVKTSQRLPTLYREKYYIVLLSVYFLMFWKIYRLICPQYNGNFHCPIRK